MKKQNKWILFSLLVLNLLFLIYYVSLAIYSRLHYDDLHFIWKLREMSMWGYIKEMYFSRSGRFMGYVTNAVIFKIIDCIGLHQIWPVLFYIFGVCGCYYVVQKFVISVSKSMLFAAVWLFYNLYVLTAVDFAVFNWLCALSYYVLPVIALLQMYELTKPSLSKKSNVLLFCTALYLGGGQEAFAPIVLCMMLVWGLYIWHSYQWSVAQTWRDDRARRLLWVTAIMLIALVVVVIAPGNYARMADTSEFPTDLRFGDYLIGFVKAAGTFAYFQFFYLPYYLVLMLLVIYLMRFVNRPLPSRFALYVTIGFIVYFALTLVPSVFLWGGFGIQRNYTHLVFALMLYLVLLAVAVSDKIKVAKWVVPFLQFGVVTLCVVMLLNLCHDIPIAHNYAKAVDQRIDYCLDMKNKVSDGILIVEPLPSTATIDTKYMFFKLLGKESPQQHLYYTSDTDVEPNEYACHFSKVYNLGFKVVLDDATN